MRREKQEFTKLKLFKSLSRPKLPYMICIKNIRHIQQQEQNENQIDISLNQTGLRPEFLEQKKCIIPNIFIFSLSLPHENNYLHGKNDSQKETLHLA